MVICKGSAKQMKMLQVDVVTDDLNHSNKQDQLMSIYQLVGIIAFSKIRVKSRRPEI
jgi:hypothetical protein